MSDVLDLFKIPDELMSRFTAFRPVVSRPVVGISIWRSDRGRAGWPKGRSTCALCVTPGRVAVMRVGMVPGYTPSKSGSGMTRM